MNLLNLPYSQFSFPRNLERKEQLSFCLSIIQKYRAELPQLRATTTRTKSQLIKSKKKIEQWKEKYQKKEEENEHLKKEIVKLEREIETLTKTNNRYRASLFDHGNFQSPTKQEKKQKGGQFGHTDTNREQKEYPQNYLHKHLFVNRCNSCGGHLARVKSTRQKILFDIVLNPQVTKLLIESERQWCGHCKKEVIARNDQSMPFTEYGINTFMMALLLRYRCHLPFSKIAIVLGMGYGLDISESGISSIFNQSKKYLGKQYEQLKTIIRDGEVMYTDETGWQVRGVNAWMWIMANEQATVYVAAESRGKGIATEMYGNSQSYSMHDGYSGYTTAIPINKHLYCWSHIIRWCFEETESKGTKSNSVKIRDALVATYHLQKDPKYHKNPLNLEKEVIKQIDKLLVQKPRDETSIHLLRRLRQQRDGLIRALVVSPNGTNNFAEQELRPIALARKISYGSDTYSGMETTAILSSVVQTYARTKRESFFPDLSHSLQAGFVNS